MAEGTVRWFDGVRGYGFISPDGGGPDVRFDSTEIQTNNHKSVEAGERVVFAFKFEARRARAVKVIPLGERAPLPDVSRPPSTDTPHVPGTQEWVGCWLTVLLLACVAAAVVMLVRTSW